MFAIDPPLRFSHYGAMATTDEVYNELIRRLEAKEVKGKDIATLLGTHPSRISEIRKNNGKRALKAKEVDTLAQFFGMGDVSANDDASSVIWIPVIGIASAGSWREATQISSYAVPLPHAPGRANCFGVEVFGDSMDKVMSEGSIAIVNPDDKRLYDGRVYLISNHEFEATIKRYRTNPARFDPDSHNPEHQPIYVDEHQISVIGRVVHYVGDQGL